MAAERASCGLGGLPPGCRDADTCGGVSRLDDLSPAQLWRLLDERQKSLLYRRFFRDEWTELAAILDDPPPNAGETMRALWLAWRDNAAARMAMNGEIGGTR